MAYDQNAWDDNQQPWQTAPNPIQPRPGEYAPGGATPRPTPLRPTGPTMTPQPNQPPTTSIPDGNGGAVFVPPQPPRTAPWMAPTPATRPVNPAMGSQYYGTGGRVETVTNRTVINPWTGQPASQDYGSTTLPNGMGSRAGDPRYAGTERAAGDPGDSYGPQSTVLDPEALKRGVMQPWVDREALAQDATATRLGITPWEQLGGYDPNRKGGMPQEWIDANTTPAQKRAEALRLRTEQERDKYAYTGISGSPITQDESEFFNPDGSINEAAFATGAARGRELSMFDRQWQAENPMSGNEDFGQYVERAKAAKNAYRDNAFKNNSWGQGELGSRAANAPQTTDALKERYSGPGAGGGTVNGIDYGAKNAKLDTQIAKEGGLPWERGASGSEGIIDDDAGYWAAVERERAGRGGVPRLNIPEGVELGPVSGGYRTRPPLQLLDPTYGQGASRDNMGGSSGYDGGYDKGGYGYSDKAQGYDVDATPWSEFGENANFISKQIHPETGQRLKFPGEILPTDERYVPGAQILPNGRRIVPGAAVGPDGARITRGADINTAGERRTLFDAINATGERLGAGPDIDPTESARLLKMQGYEDSQLEKLLNGPDRYSIAKTKWDDFLKESEADIARQSVDLKRAAAESGYLGSGRLTNQYGDLDERRELNRNLAKSRFLTEALEGTIGDNRYNTGVASDVATRQFGQDAAKRGEQRTERAWDADVDNTNYARGSQERNEARTERAYKSDVESANIDLGYRDRNETRAERASREALEAQNIEIAARQRDEQRREREYLDSIDNINYGRDVTDRNEARTERDFIRSVEDSNYDRGAAERSERRTERDAQLGIDNLNYQRSASERDEGRTEREYQRQLAEAAIARRIQQQAAEQGWSQQEFENAMRMYTLGNEGSPEGAYSNAAAIAGQEAAGASGNVADLVRAMVARNAKV